MQTARLIGLAGFVMGLLSGVALAQPGATPVVLNVDEDGVQRATVVLDSYLFDPHHLVVHVGTPVELELTSVTLITPHNFVLAEPAAGMDVNQSVGAGDSAAVRFTPTKPGIYTFYCDKQLLFFPSHREEGMEGRLEVRE